MNSSMYLMFLSAIIFLTGCSTQPKGPTIEIPNYYAKLEVEKEQAKALLESIESSDLISIMNLLHPDFVIYPPEVNTELTKNEFTGKVVDLMTQYPDLSFSDIELRPVLSPDTYEYEGLSLITLIKRSPEQESSFRLLWYIEMKDSSIYRIRQFSTLISGN